MISTAGVFRDTPRIEIAVTTLPVATWGDSRQTHESSGLRLFTSINNPELFEWRETLDSKNLLSWSSNSVPTSSMKPARHPDQTHPPRTLEQPRESRPPAPRGPQPVGLLVGLSGRSQE